MVSLVMRWFVLISLMLSTAFLQAQDWSLFPPGQRSYYAQTSSNGRIQVLEIDSINGNTHYFNKQPPSEVSLDTYSQMLENNFNQERLDSIIVFEDSILIYVYAGPFKIITSIGPGETIGLEDGWVEDCLVNEEMVFGVLDSVKTFYFSNYAGSGEYRPGIFRLSKHYGLVEFTHPLAMLWYYAPITDLPFYLFAAEKSEIYYGEEFAGWDDFFPVSGGDRLYYQYSDNTYLGGGDTTYREVYILSVTRTVDSLIVYAKNKYIQTDGSISYSDVYTIEYPRWYIEPMLYSRAYTPILYSEMSPYYSYVYYSLNRYYEYYANGKISSGFNLSFTGDLLSPEGYLEEGTDQDKHYKYSTYAGIKLFRDYGMSGFVEDTLIGFQIGDSIWGVTELPTGILNPNSNQIILYPNPVNDFVHLSGIYPGQPEWQIIDIQGRIQMNGVLRENELDISLLPSGYYYLYLHGVGGAGFVKE